MTSEERPLDAAIRALARGRGLPGTLELWRPATWTELDARIREGHPWWSSADRPDHGWLTGNGRAAAPRSPFGGPRPTTGQLALALCDADGRVREAALAHAAGRPAVLPLVAVRTADWAEPVRRRARQVLAAALPGADEPTLAVTVPVMIRVGRRLRGTESTALLREFLDTAPGTAVRALMLHRDRPTRRLALDLAVERGLLPAGELARLAAYDEDTAVRGRAATAALAAGVPDETLPLLLGARSGDVRSAGVTALRRAGRAVEAEPFLYDRSGLVRACARWVLRQDGRDPLPLYRTACADPKTVPDRAPLGLAECGERAADLPLLWELTAHERAQVRALAVAGLRVFEVADHARLLPLLDDPAPGVVREAARALLPWADRLPEQELLRRTGPGRPLHVRVRALRLLRESGSGAYEATARRLCEDPDPVARLRFRRALGIEEAGPRRQSRRFWSWLS
ncbi:hypothetical protein [Streptomyces roseoviridis]|uniref:HEAT repeat domain-containing protein n=1 Tax=Streptomyces roseoviridis TaxID=67361 RepID=A0ABV5QI64_9ACTN